MQLNHYLNFRGQAYAAFSFYQTVFGGEFSFIKYYYELSDIQVPEEEKDYLIHISLPINTYTTLMASDITKTFCNTQTPFIIGSNHYISINLEAHEETEAHRLFNELSVNGQIESSLQKTFWGALYGAFTDQFGIKWMINCQLEAPTS
ncbi:VOC family protein [Acinetobacter sp. ANC 4558]|uniref:VOC family protein n=1 Tax=Acinetobacter sp. ANC 4558 TaxID=1977876 RepID=UPI000A34FE36|nr:VOC family protein [Acinetobacter sp. ANC 4558]OTG87746.1 VOC family protein [Acinetobacter sp. ANC 4558]